jgi:hypothetical protein
MWSIYERIPSIGQGEILMKLFGSKSLSLILSVALSFGAILASPAQASITDQQYSSLDNFNEPSINPNYDIESIETGFDGDDPDQIYFWINFKSTITANQFVNGSKEPWAAILIFREKPASLGGDRDDIRISTSTSTGYSGNTAITARASGNDYAGETRYSLSSCSPETWTNLTNGAKWIGFSISRSCANIPDEFWVVGYTDPDDANSSTFRDWDYGPSDAWYVDISGAGGGGGDDEDSYYTEPQTIYFYQSSDVLLTKKFTNVSAYSDADLDVYFTTLTPKVCQPVNYSARIKLISIGTCSLYANQDGDDYYDPADKVRMNFKVVKAGAKIKIAPKPTAKPTMKPTPKPTKKAPESIGGKPKG